MKRYFDDDQKMSRTHEVYKSEILSTCDYKEEIQKMKDDSHLLLADDKE